MWRKARKDVSERMSVAAWNRVVIWDQITATLVEDGSPDETDWYQCPLTSAQMPRGCRMILPSGAGRPDPAGGSFPMGAAKGAATPGPP
jgi:hypothetical protein